MSFITSHKLKDNYEKCFCKAQVKDTLAEENKVKPKRNFKYYFAPITLKSAEKSTKFDLQYDTRNSFVADFPINLYGVNAGIVLQERFRIGAGYYWLNQNFNNKLLGIYATNTINGIVYPNIKGRVIINPRTKVPVPVSNLEKAGFKEGTDFYTAAQHIDFWFASLNFMSTFYSSRLLEFAIPIELGCGQFSEKLVDNSGNNFGSLGAALKPKPTTGNFIPGQIGFDILFKPHRWVYFEYTIGYRQMLVQNYTSQYRATSFDSQFNGEYYNIGVKVQIGTIYKEIRGKKKGTGKTSVEFKK